MRRIQALVFITCALTGCALEYEPCFADGEGAATTSTDRDACPDESICFDLKPPEGGAVRAGHVAVMWSQLNEVDPDPEPQIAFDIAIDSSTRRIEIPVAKIQAMSDDKLLLCERACTDEARCPCRGDVAVGTATVVAADDENKDGRLDVREATTRTYGRGATVIVRSEKEYRPAPPPFDRVFADAILAGTHAYRYVGKGADVRIGSPEEDEIFALNLCAEPGSACVLPSPTLRSF